MSTILLLLACSAWLVVASSDSNIPGVFGSFSDSSSTSTSSTSDSDSTDSRIASAVEAALRAAQATPVARAQSNIPYSKYRLRLSTLNKANTCSFFDCALLTPTCLPGTAGGNQLHLEGAVATIQTNRGEFNAVFNNAGVAEQLNDLVTFSVTFDGCRQFTLNTPADATRGVRVTSVTISTQPAAPGKAGAVNVYFRPVGANGSFPEENGNDLDKNPTLNAVEGTTKIGCDATFDGPQRAGSTSFTVTALAARPEFPLLARNETGFTSFSFSIDQAWIVDNSERNSQLRDLGFEGLPCATRARIIYDEIAIATVRTGGINTPPLEHPLLYDALLAGTAGAAPSFENFIFQLQLAAGRTQVRLRDVTLDSGAFSDLSHNSKFTPCFRVWPDPDFQVQVYIGMRNGGGQFVQGTLQNTFSPNDLVFVSQTVNGRQIFATRKLAGLPLAQLPQFQVNEIAFGNIRQNEFAPVRPIEAFPSDVSIVLEDCPDFSYFQ